MKTFKFAIMIACICMLYLLQPEAGNTAVRQENLQYKNGLLSVNVKKASLKELLDIIAKRARVKIYVFDVGSDTVTVNFKERSLAEGLRGILHGCSYSIVFPGDEEGSELNRVESSVHEDSVVMGYLNKQLVSSPSNTASPMSENNAVFISKTVYSNSSGVESILYGAEDDEVIITGYEESQRYPNDDGDVHESLYADESGEAITGYYEGDEYYAYDDSNINEDSYAKAEDTPSWYYEGMSQEEARLRYRIDVLEREIESGYADRHYDDWAGIRGDQVIRHASERIEEYRKRLENLVD